MAKKAKEAAPEVEAEKPEGENGEAAAPKKVLGKIFGALKSRKVLLIALPALLLILGGGGAGAYFFLFRHDAAKEAKAEEVPLTPPDVAFADVDKLTVNIQGADATPTYLQLSVTLELENDAQKAGITALMPRVKDQFQAYLRELRTEDIKGSEGAMRLKEELLRRVNVATAPYKVRDVLLKEIITQ
jgi:flagellar FliL protein